MKRPVSKFIHLCLLLLGVCPLLAQNPATPLDLDLLAYSDYYSYTFYQQKDSLHYEQMVIKLTQENEVKSLQLEGTGRVSPLTKIQEIYPNLLWAGDLDDYPEPLTGAYHLAAKTYPVDTAVPGDTLILNPVNAFVSAIYQLKLPQSAKEVQGKGPLLDHPNFPDLKWKIADANFFHDIPIRMRGGGVVHLLSQFGKKINGLYFFYEGQILGLHEHAGAYRLIPNPKLDLPARYRLQDFQPLDYFQDQNYKGDTKNLFSLFGKPILPQSIDSLVLSSWFVWVQKEGRSHLFGMDLQAYPDSLFRAAYLYREGAELLSDTGAYLLNADFQKVSAFTQESLILCGTVGSSHYELSDDPRSENPHQLSVKHGGMGASKTEIYEILLTGLHKKAKLSFLNGKQVYYRDDNDRLLETPEGYPEYLLVNQGKKQGLYQYHFVLGLGNVLPAKVQSTEPEVVRSAYPQLIEAMEVLPVQYDSIRLIPGQKAFFLYKKGQTQLFYFQATNFAYQTSLPFDQVQKISPSFYRVRRKKRSGWLDVHTGREYFPD